MKKIDIGIKTIFVILFLLAVSFAGKVDAAAPGTNIKVCVDPPKADLTDPTMPKISFETSDHPFYYYQMTVSRDSILSAILYDTGVQKYESGANPPGIYTLTVPKGLLPIDDTTYYYAVRVKDAYDWSPYAQGEFVLRGTKTDCSSVVSFRDETRNAQAADERSGVLVNIFARLPFFENRSNSLGLGESACGNVKTHGTIGTTSIRFGSDLPGAVLVKS